MKRAWFNYIVDIIIALSFVALAVTGLLKYQRIIHFFAGRGITLPADGITQVHRWSGGVLTAGAVLHLVLHWKWLMNMTGKVWRRFFPRDRTERVGTRSAARREMLREGRAQGKMKKWAPGVIGGVFIILMIVLILAVNHGEESSRLFPGQSSALGIEEQLKRPQPSGDPPDFTQGQMWSGDASISIKGEGTFDFRPSEVESVRPDIFTDGAFSVFDILVHLDGRGDISMRYSYDEELATHVIRSINGNGPWWYRIVYDGGWSENNVFRMDLYPFKEGSSVTVAPEREERMERIYSPFRGETGRLERNAGKIVIPEVFIDGTRENLYFENVEVTAHDLRPDLFHEGVITAIDVIMSLGDQGKIDYDIGWFDSIGTARIVRNFIVQRINEDAAAGRCGFVYESGSHDFYGFSGNHIHLPPDSRVLTSPDYVRFFWICI
jgi:hypothetical protein